ncbi:MAG: GNAT family N-acetyltransferase [Gammaproteobacteria bacterium]|nr:GNAT family N-acetyltransferase [Gammaproteobacteria bacterium]
MSTLNTVTNTQQSMPSPRFTVTIAATLEEIRECQRLRYEVFANEMKAQLDTPLAGHDVDYFDDYCDHLYVRDMDTQTVIATTRILTNKAAHKAGSYYSETEFDIKNIVSAPSNYMEVGRTCVHARYRRGVGLHYLWQGVGNIMSYHRAQYLFGCVSIPHRPGDTYIANIMHHIRKNHYAPGYLRVTPRMPVNLERVDDSVPVVLPPLLRTYLKMGALACGEPSLDEKFGVADIFILVDRQHMNQSYDRHFTGGL